MEDAPVYTLLTREQVEELIHTHYDLGRVVEYKVSTRRAFANRRNVVEIFGD
jgi:(2Fe-2S) ferredoxin